MTFCRNPCMAYRISSTSFCATKLDMFVQKCNIKYIGFIHQLEPNYRRCFFPLRLAIRLDLALDIPQLCQFLKKKENTYQGSTGRMSFKFTLTSCKQLCAKTQLIWCALHNNNSRMWRELQHMFVLSICSLHNHSPVKTKRIYTIVYIELNQGFYRIRLCKNIILNPSHCSQPILEFVWHLFLIDKIRMRS